MPGTDEIRHAFDHRPHPMTTRNLNRWRRFVAYRVCQMKFPTDLRCTARSNRVPVRVQEPRSQLHSNVAPRPADRLVLALPRETTCDRAARVRRCALRRPRVLSATNDSLRLCRSCVPAPVSTLRCLFVRLCRPSDSFAEAIPDALAQ